MFCPLTRIEIKTDYCPAKTCMYKDHKSGCAHDELTKEGLTVVEVAEIKGIKPYKVKADASLAKDMLSKGMVILKYGDFIKDSFPSGPDQVITQGPQTVNGGEDQTYKVLLNVFGLSEYQQSKFWEQDRYVGWAIRNKIDLDLKDLRAAIAVVQTQTGIT